ncbi:O-antigen ligase family protein [uncultured Dialister sp.]|jgi:putative inorganic carbon (HCO3(-)) transporter|uniref:O-antigen ligase family protein n=1 Tax=uncultured Dialister sp. TaxID=278064 RepID=UPI0025DAD02F|nr:O-antigen ligase family protein [uncultured Dialister sp.]
MGKVSENGLCSKQHILYLLYATLFLLPLNPFLFYVTLLPAVMAWLYNWRKKGEVALALPPLWQPGAVFLVCSFLSAFVSKDMAFSFMNWALQPLMYALVYLLIYTTVSTEKEKEKALYAFLAGAVVTVVYGFFQYANAADMEAQSWVDPERFPLLRRRMYSTLENPNLFGAYLLMIISILTAFTLRERAVKKKTVFAVILLSLLLCLALTYSRGAWVSLAAIVLGLTLFYDKRFGLLFLLVPVVLTFYHGQVVERFLSLFSGEDTSVDLRFALWESTMAMIEEHPLLGVGWGAYFLAYPDYNFFIQEEGVLIFHAHNMYLNMLAEVGIPGGMAFLLAFFAQGILCWRNYRHGNDSFTKSMGLGGVLMVMALSVISMGDHVLFSRSVSFCFWSLSALCASCRK